MAISYPLQFPTVSGVADITFNMRNARATTASPFTGRKKQYKWPLQVWDVDITLPPMKRDMAETWITFLAKLNAGVSTDFSSFYLTDPNGYAMGGQVGDFQVNAGGDPNTVNLSNMNSLRTNALVAGDYIRIGTGSSARLHKVLDTVDTSIAGTAQVSIWPATYQSLNDTEGSLQDAYGVFTLKSPNVSYNINNISSYGINFSAESLV